MFNTVQELIISRSRIRPQAEVHLFTNTLFCADCGRGMHFKKNRKGYVCGNFNKYGSKACSDHFIKERELEEIILNDIKSFAQRMDLDNLIDRVIKQLESDTKNNTTRLSQVEQIDKLKKQKVQLTSLFADNSIDIEEYRLTIEEINKKIDQLMPDKLKLEKFKEQSKREQKNMKQLKKEYIHFNQLTPEMLHRLVDRIE
jgi:site-specific DNA recombinase